MPFLVEIGMSSERRTVLVQFVVMGGDSWLHLTQAKFTSYIYLLSSVLWVDNAR